MYRVIMAPVDLSPLETPALSVAARLARQLDATLHLVRVLAPPIVAQTVPPKKAFEIAEEDLAEERELTPQTYAQKRIVQPGLPWWDADIATADAYLSGQADFVATRGVAAKKDVILNTDVPSAILDYAIRNRANCIAVATNGVGGIRRFVFGTVADELTRKSPISLLVFHPNPQATTDSVPGISEAAAATGG